MTTKLSTYTHTIDSSLNEEMSQHYISVQFHLVKRVNGSREHDRIKNRPAEHLNFRRLMPPKGKEGMCHNTSKLIHGIALQHHQKYR